MLTNTNKSFNKSIENNSVPNVENNSIPYVENNSESNIVVLARLEKQEAKVGDLITAVNKFHEVFVNTMNCVKDTIKNVNTELITSRRERVEQNEQFMKLMTSIREDYAVQIT